MARQWRCAVVGSGTVGEWHIRSLCRLSDCQPVAVCDIDPSKASKALEKNALSLPIYTDAQEMYRKEKFDVVHICTPSGDHLGPTIAAMQHGKHVIVEKPMEILPERIDQMIEAATKHGVRLAGIFQNRWNDANRALKDAVAQGRFGRIAWAAAFTPWFRTDEYYAAGGWRGTWKLDGGGAVMNQGVHQVDLLQWVMGPVKTVSAFASSRIHPKIEVEDTLTCALQFANGAYGTFVSSTAMWPGGAARLEVGGENGSAISENGLRRFEFRNPLPADKELQERLDPEKAANSAGGVWATDVGLDLHCKNLVSIFQSWERGEEATTYGPEARKAVAIVQAMYQSARKNGAAVDVI
jgi:predicted dehydrogenase